MILSLALFVNDALAVRTLEDWRAEQRRARANGALAGVIVGGPMDTRGFTCEGVTCTKVATVAGEVGQLSVKLCGTTVRQVAFQAMFIAATPSNLEVTQAEPWIRSAITPSIAAALTKENLAAGLAASGWSEQVNLRESQIVGSSEFLRETWTNAQEHTRRLLLSSSQAPQLGLVYIVNLVTWPEPSCTNGL